MAAGRSLTQQQLEAAAPSNSSADATAISAALAKGDLNAASLAIAEASARGNVAALADAMAISLASGTCKRSLCRLHEDEPTIAFYAARLFV